MVPYNSEALGLKSKEGFTRSIKYIYIYISSSTLVASILFSKVTNAFVFSPTAGVVKSALYTLLRNLLVKTAVFPQMFLKVVSSDHTG